MSWGGQPAKPEVQHVKGWGSSPLAVPKPDPVEGWWTRAVKLQALAQLSAEGSLSADIFEIHTVPALFTAEGNLSAEVEETGDGLQGTMWELYTMAGAMSAVGSLSVSVLSRPSLFGQFGGAGTLSATMNMYRLKVDTSFSSAGNLSAAMGFPAFAAAKVNYSTNVTYTIPFWCKYIDIVALGGGSGGSGGGGSFTTGKGGEPGEYQAVTLQRGVHIPWGTTSITIQIGAGGGGGNGGITGGKAGDGGDTFVIINGSNVAIGQGGQAPSVSLPGGDRTGHGPGNLTFNGETYTGGADSTGNGNPPGGGGYSGNGGLFTGSNGSPGAAGRVWLKAFQ